MNSTVATNSDVYYNGSYWNDYDQVKSYLNQRVSGDCNVDWIDFCISRGFVGRALILNCGNGWVERELIDRGMISSAVSIYFSQTLIAETKSNCGQRKIEYICHDINNFKFPVNEFDLVINYAALHHTAYLQRTLLACNSALKLNGKLISLDYVGPHRNQYSFDNWQKIDEINQLLPINAQQYLVYPHLPTMMVTDPTEAIHSELIIEAIRNFITNLVDKPLGGSIAYPILTHNSNLSKLSENEKASTIEMVLNYDRSESSTLEESFFAFLVSVPKNQNELDVEICKQIIDNEKNLELVAEKNAGEYYKKTYIQRLNEELSDLRIGVEHKQSYLEDLQKEIEELKKSDTSTSIRKIYKKIRTFLRHNS
jgi:SAM-dependent methyltransferase